MGHLGISLTGPWDAPETLMVPYRTQSQIYPSVHASKVVIIPPSFQAISMQVSTIVTHPLRAGRQCPHTKGAFPGHDPATQPIAFPPALRQEALQLAPICRELRIPIPPLERHRRRNQCTLANLSHDCATRYRADGIRQRLTPQAGFLISQSSQLGCGLVSFLPGVQWWGACQPHTVYNP